MILITPGILTSKCVALDPDRHYPSTGDLNRDSVGREFRPVAPTQGESKILNRTLGFCTLTLCLAACLCHVGRTSTDRRTCTHRSGAEGSAENLHDQTVSGKSPRLRLYVHQAK
jgi:hypothetical protein